MSLWPTFNATRPVSSVEASAFYVIRRRRSTYPASTDFRLWLTVYPLFQLTDATPFRHHLGTKWMKKFFSDYPTKSPGTIPSSRNELVKPASASRRDATRTTDRSQSPGLEKSRSIHRRVALFYDFIGINEPGWIGLTNN